MGLQIGIRLHDTKERPLEERLEQIHTDGFTCVHMAISKIPEGKGTSFAAFTPGYGMYMKHLFENQKVDMAVLGCYQNLATPDEAALLNNLKKYEAHIRLASIMGAGVVGTETGAPNKEYKYTEECRSEEALATFIKNLRTVVEYAEKMGVIVAIEPVAKHIVWNASRARTVLDEIHSPNLRIIFDPVNLLDMTNFQHAQEIFEETMELLEDEIAIIHLKDFQIVDGEMISVAAGDGEMDYTQIMKFLKEKKPFVQATLENTNPENAVRARKYIENIWKSV